MTERLRGRPGQRQRQRRLAAHIAQHGPICIRCRRVGATRMAEAGPNLPLLMVDHIRPLALGGEDVDGNTRVLCEPCHDEVTAEQFGHATSRRLGACDAAGRPTHPDHPWNRVR